MASRDMPRLKLGEARVAELMACQPSDPGPPAGAVDDLVQPGGRQRLTPPRALQHHEHPVGGRRPGPLCLVVAGRGGEEPRRHGNDPLAGTLALSHEQSTLSRPHVTEAEAEHLAATQAAQDHGLDHGPIALGAQRRHERVDLGRLQDLWQRPGRPDQRHAPHHAPLPGPPRRQPPGHRVGGNAGVASGDQIGEEARQRRQPPLDRPRRQPGLAVLQPDDLGAAARCTLRLDEVQHVSRRHRRRLLLDHREEDLQVVRDRQQRVGPTPRRHELQVVIERRMAHRYRIESARAH